MKSHETLSINILHLCITENTRDITSQKNILISFDFVLICRFLDKTILCVIALSKMGLLNLLKEIELLGLLEVCSEKGGVLSSTIFTSKSPMLYI